MIDEKDLEAAFETEVADITPTSALWEKVREHTSPRHHWQRRAWTRRAVSVAAAALALVTVGVAAAQSGLLWRLFPGIKAPAPTSHGTLYSSVKELRIEEAEKLAGFHIKLPRILPAGVNSEDVSATVGYVADEKTPLVTVGYWTVQEHTGGASAARILTLQQLPIRDRPWFRPQNWRTPDGQPMPVTCEQQRLDLRPGVQAIWFTCSYGGSYLTWVDDGYEFKLNEAAVKLTREDLIEIARSIE